MYRQMHAIAHNNALEIFQRRSQILRSYHFFRELPRGVSEFRLSLFSRGCKYRTRCGTSCTANLWQAWNKVASFSSTKSRRRRKCLRRLRSANRPLFLPLRDFAVSPPLLILRCPPWLKVTLFHTTGLSNLYATRGVLTKHLG